MASRAERLAELEEAQRNCPVCKGTVMLFDDPTVRRGSWRYCECEVSIIALRKAITGFERSRLTLRQVADQTFESFEASTSELKRVKDIATAYACKPEGNLILYGDTGRGKTHLATAALIELIDSGRGGQFWFVPRFLSEIRRGFSRESRGDGWYDPVEAAIGAEVLLFDDLGAEKWSDWVDEQTLLVINERGTSGLPTICTTNLNPEALAAKGKPADRRLWSRLLHESKSIPVPGANQRLVTRLRRKDSAA